MFKSLKRDRVSAVLSAFVLVSLLTIETTRSTGLCHRLGTGGTGAGYRIRSTMIASEVCLAQGHPLGPLGPLGLAGVERGLELDASCTKISTDSVLPPPPPAMAQMRARCAGGAREVRARCARGARQVRARCAGGAREVRGRGARGLTAWALTAWAPRRCACRRRAGSSAAARRCRPRPAGAPA